MDTYYTDENGQFTTGYYVCGDDWTIREISPSEGYLLDGTVYLKPRLVQIANGVIKSDKYPECKERCRGIKARRGHKKAIIAICRMLLIAIWNVLSKLEPYSAKGYLEDKLTEHSVVISKSQGLELLRKRGYIFKDEVSADSG